MPRRLLIFFIVCLSISTGMRAGEGASFTGSWDGPESKTSAFSLDLVQTGDHLEGYHSSVVRSGKRIDAVLAQDGKPSITGTISGNTAHVQFRSGYYEDTTGEVELKLRDGKLEWKILNSSGPHYLPESSVLSREKRRRSK